VTSARVTSLDDYRSALNAGGFDLILSDYTLPGFDGLAWRSSSARLDHTSHAFPFSFRNDRRRSAPSRPSSVGATD